MAILNSFGKVTNGDYLYEGFYNGQATVFLGLNILNAVRMIKDSSAVNVTLFNPITSFQDCFAESYNGALPIVEEDNSYSNLGRNGRISINSTARCIWTNYNTVEVYPTYFYPAVQDLAAGDSSWSDVGYSNPTYAFDGDDSTYASYDNAAASHYLGKTFGARTITMVRVRGHQYNYTGGTDRPKTYLDYYNGGSWVQLVDLYGVPGSEARNPGFDYTWTGSQACQGIRVRFDGNAGGTHKSFVYCLEYGTAMSSASYVEMNIPSGTFSATTKSAFCTALVKDWETGADIQFKLKNGSEDSGWLATNTPVNFTAFTSQPTILQVKLIPKVSSPTALYPSIYGAGVHAW